MVLIYTVKTGLLAVAVESVHTYLRKSPQKEDKISRMLLMNVMWVWLRPLRLPRPLSGIMFGLVYCPPDATAQKQKDLVEYMIGSVDLIRSVHPDCGIVISGDINCLDITDILANHNLKQVVQDPTRGNNILDLIVTNLFHLYSAPAIIAPLGRSDHNTILWSANTSCTSTSNRPSVTKRYVRRFTQSSCEAFGRWCSTHEWFTDIQGFVSATNLTTSFTTELLSATNQLFPTKLLKMHDTDKPWMTPTLKQLIIKRKRAFHSGDRVLWRHYRNKVQNEIRSRKHAYYANKVQHLKSSNPKKWWDCVKQMSGKKKAPSTSINIIKDGGALSGTSLANVVNDHFLSINADLPPLDLSSLPAYLPAPQPVPTITHIEVSLTCDQALIKE